MATSSSDGSCTAPADFQLSSELDDVNERLDNNLFKCPLCHNNRRNFYCRQCIQNGELVHSISVYSERYAANFLEFSIPSFFFSDFTLLFFFLNFASKRSFAYTRIFIH